MKRSLLVLPLLAALAGLLLLLWLKKPGGPPTSTASPPPPSARPVHAHEAHEHPAEAEQPETVPSPNAPTGDVLLRVTARGAPLAEAEVILIREGRASRMRFQTGPDGTRLILRVPAGPYVAAVTHPRFLPGELHLSVPAGARAAADVELKSGARIFGRVTDRAGAPLPGTTVTLIDADTRFNTSSHYTAKSDDDGRYELPPAGAGEFGVRFKHPRFKPHEHFGLQVRTGTEELEVNAVLEVGARVAGRVLDESGMPLAGAQVLFGNDGGGGLAKSDAEGRFTVYGLTDGYVSGSAALKGYGTAYRRGVPPNTLDLEFRLSKGGILAGRLIVEPLPEHFTVSLARYDPELGRPLRIHQKAVSFPPKGAFQVEDVAPGTYWVEIEVDGYEIGDAPQVTVSPGQTTPDVTIRLRKK